MNKTRKLLAALMIGMMLATTGCGTAWWSNFKKDPVAQTESILQTVATIVSVATVVFGDVKQSLPVDKQTVAQAKFDESILTLNKSMDAVRAAVQVAADAKQEHPDLSKVIGDLTNAVSAVQGVVDEFKVLVSAPPGAAPGVKAPSPRGYDVLSDQVAALKHRTAVP